jgi:hypothetical protein
VTIGGVTTTEIGPAPAELLRWLEGQRAEAADALRAIAAAWPPPQHAAAHARVLVELTAYLGHIRAARDAIAPGVRQAPKTAKPGGTRWMIRRYFTANPGPANAHAILKWIRASGIKWETNTTRPATTIAGTMAQLADQGDLIRRAIGVYEPAPEPETADGASPGQA